MANDPLVHVCVVVGNFLIPLSNIAHGNETSKNELIARRGLLVMNHVSKLMVNPAESLITRRLAIHPKLHSNAALHTLLQ